MSYCEKECPEREEKNYPGCSMGCGSYEKEKTTTNVQEEKNPGEHP